MSSRALSCSTPARSIAPCVGLKPRIPQNDAGRIVEPAVWLPNAIGTIPSATAAAEPLEEPPGVRRGSSGFTVLAGLVGRELGR